MISTTKKGLKAALFHWMISFWTHKGLADGTVTFAVVVDEMMMLYMEDLVHMNHTVVYGAYKDAVRFAQDMIAESEG